MRSASNAKPARRSPKVVGSAWTPWVRPTQSVSRCSQRPVDERVAKGGRARDQDRPGLAQLQRERGVEHVGGGQPVVDPAALVADRRGDDVDERGDVVVGDPLALLDRLDGERGALAAGRGRLGRAPPRPRPRHRSPRARPRASRSCGARASRRRRSPRACSGGSRVDYARRRAARRSWRRRSRRRRPGRRAASARRRAARRARRGSCRGSARRSPAGRCGRRRRPGAPPTSRRRR